MNKNAPRTYVLRSLIKPGTYVPASFKPTQGTTQNICSWLSLLFVPPRPRTYVLGSFFLAAPQPRTYVLGCSSQLARCPNPARGPSSPSLFAAFSSSRRLVKYLTAAVNSSRRGEANNCSGVNIRSVGITWVIYYETVKQHVPYHVLVHIQVIIKRFN